MAGKTTRGYSNYRGKRTGYKIAIAVVLVVILACALLFLRFQDNIVFDEHGAHFVFQNDGGQTQTQTASATDSAQKDPNAGLVVDIQKPANALAVIRAASAKTLSGGDVLKTEGDTAFIYTVMGEDGKLEYASAVADAISAGASGTDAKMADSVAAMKNSGLYAVARMSCFRDDAYLAYNPSAAIKNVDGKTWRDGNIKSWLSPYSSDAAAYVTAIASECAKAGYNEILLDNAFFPTYGRTERLNFSGETATKTEAVNAFLTSLGEALKQYDVRLAIAVPSEYVLSGSDADAGFDLKTLPACVERLYVSGGDETALRAAYKAARPDSDADACIVFSGSSVSGSSFTP
jgi:hypothetical protein